MVELDFAVESARSDAGSVSPLILFAVRVTNRTPGFRIQSVSLQTQIRIEPTRRRYGGDEPDRLLDLFGEQRRWSETLHGFMWAQPVVAIPAFETQTVVEIPAPCSIDFNLASTKYLHALKEGDAPVSFHFSGAVFYRDEDGRLQVAQIPSSKEDEFRLPASVWAEMMQRHFGRTSWVPLDCDVFEQLYAFRRRKGLPNWEAAIAVLLEQQAAEASP